jgi:protease I
MTASNLNIAFLTSNGVLQNDIATMQRALIAQRVFPKVIGAGGKLITAWDGEGNQWGHNFAVDVSVTEALGVDYDILIVPGGERAIEGLCTTAHTKRILNSFMTANKPVILMSDAASVFKSFDLPLSSGNVKLVEEVTEDTVQDAMTWFANFQSAMPLDQQAA